MSNIKTWQNRQEESTTLFPETYFMCEEITELRTALAERDVLCTQARADAQKYLDRHTEVCQQSARQLKEIASLRAAAQQALEALYICVPIIPNGIAYEHAQGVKAILAEALKGTTP